MLNSLRKLFARKVRVSEYLPYILSSHLVTPDEKANIEHRHIAIGELIDTSTKIERAYQQATEIAEAGKSKMAGFSRVYDDMLSLRADLQKLASCHINFPANEVYRKEWKDAVLEGTIIRNAMQEYHAQAFPKPTQEPKAQEP